ncbi:hypothetical protein ACLOAU_05565 [Niabella sp. CJ426]|uniref:hypothetical protein n=1 Tax=Niabella sp. CJ426 TaxID=3393740 RepID=UPI003D02B064
MEIYFYHNANASTLAAILSTMRKTPILSVLIVFLSTACHVQSGSAPTIVDQDDFTIDTSLVPKDNTAFYFPLNLFSDTSRNVSLDSFVVKWYSEQLFALREPVIYLDKSQKEIYRFTWLRTFHNPVAIRIEKHGDQYFLCWKLSDGAGGYKPGKLTIDQHKKLDKQTWDAFVKKLSEIDFWKLPTNQNDRGLDGSEWILEGKSENNYHVVNRWTPNKNNGYYECCNFLLGLTDLKIKDREKY